MPLDPIAKSLFARSPRGAPNRAKVSDFIGEVGQRQEFDLTVKVAQTRQGDYGLRHWVVAEDSDGNVVVYSGSVWLGSPDKSVRVRATVRAHDVYRGTRQTVISRPKVLSRRTSGDEQIETQR